MHKAVSAIAATFALLTSAQASVVSSQTYPDAASAAVYDTFHDAPTDFVFVRLPSGWSFVAKDAGSRRHEVFHDARTGFVFVKLSTGWVFVLQDQAA